jgi:crossover junction endodeoxyribonuclease RuvC
MLILGIDPGTGRTGWGVVEYKKGVDKIIYVAHGCLSTDQERPMHERLLLVHDGLTSIVEEFNPHCMIVEQIFFGINSRTAISVSQARGISMLVAAQRKIPFYEYTSMQVKSVVAGSGKTEKKEMQKVVRRLLSKNERTLSFNAKDKAFDDAADALAIAIHHAWKLDGKDIIIKQEKERLKKIEKIKLKKSRVR